MIIKKLIWDSTFFGYNIGKCILSDSNIFDARRFKNQASSFKLVYVFADYEINHSQLKLVDIKVTLVKKKEKNENVDYNKIKIYNKEEDDFFQLEKLALISGKYSRFKIDVNFENNEYENLYKEWIKNSIYKDKALAVNVFKEENKILGFATLHKKTEFLCDIGLVAVDKNMRGKRIGTKLINYTSEQGFKMGFKKIQVVTQKNNRAAVGLYEKSGFNLFKIEYVYHYWNL